MFRIILGILLGGVIGGVIGYYGKCASGMCPLTSNPYSGAIWGGLMGALLMMPK